MSTVVVTGGTGFLGTSLVAALAARGDTVTVLSRSGRASALPPSARAAAWTPEARGAWYGEVDGASAVVHLSGEPVIGRWTHEKRERIRNSRVRSTEQVVAAIEAARVRPTVLVCASAVGYHGSDAGGAALTEASPPGNDFLARIVVEWEAAARAAERLGVRVVCLRLGVVLGRKGGALEQMLLPFKLFAGGPIGSGEQVVSWVHERDAVGLVLFALDEPAAHGPMNATAPSPATMEELATAIGRALGRPSWLRVPAFALHAALGEAASTVLGGQRVLPEVALRLGYRFAFPQLDAALRSLVGKPL